MYPSLPNWGRCLLLVLSPKMAEATINDLLSNPPKSDTKRQKLIECVLTGNSKQYLGKAYTEEHINKLSAEEVDKVIMWCFWGRS